MTPPPDWLFESIKLFSQLAGALLVAWLAVRWALRRYKMEKSWEKRLQAYSDVTIAIGEMQTVQLSFVREIEEQFSWTDKRREELWERYRVASIKLEQARAMASLLLPDDTAGTIRWLFAALEQIDDNNLPEEFHRETVEKLNHAMNSIVDQGRKSLGVFY